VNSLESHKLFLKTENLCIYHYAYAVYGYDFTVFMSYVINDIVCTIQFEQDEYPFLLNRCLKNGYVIMGKGFKPGYIEEMKKSVFHVYDTTAVLIDIIPGDSQHLLQAYFKM